MPFFFRFFHRWIQISRDGFYSLSLKYFFFGETNVMHCHVESPLMLLSRNAYADGSYMVKVVVWKPWRIGEMRRPKSILHITSRARIRVPFSYSFYLFIFILKKRSSTWFSTKMACGFRAGQSYIVGSTIYIGRQLVYNNKRIHTSPGRLFLFSHDGWGR
jgi:hypothetical protein